MTIFATLGINPYMSGITSESPTLSFLGIRLLYSTLLFEQMSADTGFPLVFRIPDEILADIFLLNTNSSVEF